MAKKILTKNAIDWMSGEAKPWVFTFGKIGFNVGTINLRELLTFIRFSEYPN